MLSVFEMTVGNSPECIIDESVSEDHEFASLFWRAVTSRVLLLSSNDSRRLLVSSIVKWHKMFRAKVILRPSFTSTHHILRRKSFTRWFFTFHSAQSIYRERNSYRCWYPTHFRSFCFVNEQILSFDVPSFSVRRRLSSLFHCETSLMCHHNGIRR